jgi:UDP-glucose 4-epimerase
MKDNRLENVSAIRVDMRNDDAIAKAFSEVPEEFDVCLYVMGNSDIALARREPLTDIRTNIHSLINLLKRIQVEKFIFMSSGAVYEGHRGLVDPTMPVTPTIPYSIDKLASELFIRYFQENTHHVKNYVNLRFFGAYGPLEPSRKIYTNLIRTFALEKKDRYRILGNGKNFIDAMYIEDTIDALLKVVRSDKCNLTVDLCFGRPRTINELVVEVGHIFERDIVLEHEGDAAEYTTFYASPYAMETLFNFKPSINLEEGMKRFAEYLRNQQQS